MLGIISPPKKKIYKITNRVINSEKELKINKNYMAMK